MNPPFGSSNIYFRMRDSIRTIIKRLIERIRSVKIPKPTMGKIWLRLSYFEERLIRLDEDNQEVFIENFYHSMRQINYMTLLIIIVIIGTYLTTFQFRMIGFWEGFTVEALLVFTLFYMVWFYRMGMEDLMDYLLKTETTPDYAFRPRLGTRTDEKPIMPFARKIAKEDVKAKPKKRATNKPSKKKARKR
jgi:hypothetical protein